MDKTLQEKIQQAQQDLIIYKNYYESKSKIISNDIFPMPKIKLPKHLSGHNHKIKLNWGKKVIEKYQSELIFDHFSGDTVGYTYLIGKFYKNLLETIIKNTLLSGVSFVWVLKNEKSKSGSTVLFRDSASCVVEFDENNDLTFAISLYNDTDYIVYYGGKAYTLTQNNQLSPLLVDCEVVTFAIGREYGAEKIGRSIFTANFFELMKNASSLISLYSQANLLDVSNKNILLAQGVEPQMLEDGTYQEPVSEEISASGLKTLYSSASAELKLENLESLNADNFEKLLKNLVNSASSEVFLSPKEFGFSSENDYADGFLAKISKIKEDLAESVINFAYILMKNYNVDIKEEENIHPIYKKQVHYSQIGAIGDALYKLSELNVSSEMLEEYTNSLLGVSKYKEKMQIIPKRKGE